MLMKAETWRKKRDYSQEELDLALQILEAIKGGMNLQTAQREFPKPGGGGFMPKHALVAVYTRMVESGAWPEDDALLAKIRMKPTRTLSGVTTVTVLTVFILPGRLYFLSTGRSIAKNYLSEEPGAKRCRKKIRPLFDPTRIKALAAVGHPIRLNF